MLFSSGSREKISGKGSDWLSLHHMSFSRAIHHSGHGAGSGARIREGRKGLQVAMHKSDLLIRVISIMKYVKGKAGGENI